MLVFTAYFGLAQQAPSPSDRVLASLQEKQTLTENSLVKNLPFTNIGPTIMSGRVVDLTWL